MAGVLSTSKKVFKFTSPCHTNKIAIRNAIHGRPLFATQERSRSNLFKEVLATGPDYQHIEKSAVPTHHFQKSLPRLPIPELDKTCERYLRAQLPLLVPESYDYTKSCVDKFRKTEGVVCQNSLIQEDKENSHTSYISKPWFDMYLSDRRPLPINYNPFLVFMNNENKDYNKQLVKAANLVISSLRFYKSLNEGCLEPEVYHLKPEWSKNNMFKTFTKLLPETVSWYGAYLFKAFPLDMSQYTNLFNTTRVPEVGKDRLSHTPGARHLLVMRRGHFYVFDVIDKDGNIVNPDVILGGLDQILDEDDPVAEHPVGILTTADRDYWAKARKHLESIGNKEELNLIDSSLFNLVLDDATPGEDPISMVRLFLHADGVNRWFDKSFSLIVAKDGRAGINFEHSWGDGVAVLRYFNDIHRDSVRKPRAVNFHLKNLSTPIRKLKFKLDDKAKNAIAEAKKRYEKTCNSLEVRVLDYRIFGRQLCKPLNVSPDAVMQLSFQLAHDQLTGQSVPTYESCSTAAFKHGRTETVRPCTVETQNMCKALRQSQQPTKSELQQMLKNCSKVHSQLIKEAAMGLGFDRHLFALKLIAEKRGLNLEVFNDPAYKAINQNILSTSTLASDYLELGAFGPVVQNGYGIGYSVWNDRLGCIITNYSGHSDGLGFLQALEESLNKIEEILRP
ncbi:carnitine O-palmitoyltransferase 2, mitochondrial [Homalodisca vitripennis]|uniref:carnitine O-palmitoyltransferase 2, mitochondrial n=1 Tax=Homalodisca vitripennis TaxID=197043 RepID=UPI001EEB74D5|nr:carnitine O-palmitoyltransferase 2, mitochondrial [Homalodisca vitripennis]